MCALIMRRIPKAAASSDRPRGSAIRLRIARARPLRVELDAAAEGGLGVQVAEHQVGVGHGRLETPAPVAGGARCRAGALGAHAQHAAAVDASDAPPAGPDGVDAEHRQRHGVTLHEGRRRDGGPGVGDQTHVVARAPHVDGDQVAVPGAPGQQLGGREHSARRPREQQRRGSAPGELAVDHAPTAQDHQELPAEAGPAQVALEALEVASGAAGPRRRSRPWC